MRNARQEIPVTSDPPFLLVHLRERWRTIALACAVAAAASLGVSLLLPREYTATCRILMDPPAGTDPRVSTAVSPIYLESLRTYELFASSDDLFLQAAQKFGLRNNSTSIERLKKKTLRVEVLRNTKILEINATLRDPIGAHELALYLGEAAVKLNRAAAQSADTELRADAEKQVTLARQTLDRTQQAWTDAVTKGPVDQVTAELEADVQLRSRMSRELATAEVDLAEVQASAAGQARPEELKGTRARVDQLRAEVKSIEDNIAKEQALIAERSTRLSKLESANKAAEAALRVAETHQNDVRAAAGYRGERLTIIDPGIVPERPSSPNAGLNVLVAVFAALVLALLYILFEISYRHPSYD